MKKHFLLTGLLAFLVMLNFHSCSKDTDFFETSDIENFPTTRANNNVNIISSGNAMTVTPLINQLWDNPVYIYLSEGAHQKYYYFSGKAKQKVELSSKDEKNYYSRWIIKKHPFYSKGCYIFNETTQEALRTVIRPATSTSEYSASMYKIEESRLTSWNMMLEPTSDNRYFIKCIDNSAYLASKNNQDRTLAFYDLPFLDYYAKWSIVPAEEFEIIDLAFDFIPGQDTYSIETIKLDKLVMNNPDKWNDSDWDYTYTLSHSISSKFARTEAEKNSFTISSSSQTGLNIKIPFIESIDLGGNISTTINTQKTQEWSQQFTYEETNSTTQSQTFSVKFRLPPGASGEVWINRIEARLNLTYIATLKGKTTGKIIKTSGKWTGASFNNLNFNAIDNTGKPLEPISINLEEKEPEPELIDNKLKWNITRNYSSYFENGVLMQAVDAFLSSDYFVESDVSINIDGSLGLKIFQNNLVFSQGTNKSSIVPIPYECTINHIKYKLDVAHSYIPYGGLSHDDKYNYIVESLHDAMKKAGYILR